MKKQKNLHYLKKQDYTLLVPTQLGAGISTPFNQGAKRIYCAIFLPTVLWWVALGSLIAGRFLDTVVLT